MAPVSAVSGMVSPKTTAHSRIQYGYIGEDSDGAYFFLVLMGAVLGISDISVVALSPSKNQLEVQLHQHSFRIATYRGDGGIAHKGFWLPSDCLLLLVLCIRILYGTAKVA